MALLPLLSCVEGPGNGPLYKGFEFLWRQYNDSTHGAIARSAGVASASSEEWKQAKSPKRSPVMKMHRLLHGIYANIRPRKLFYDHRTSL
jgi:hypothetical protein